MPGTDGIQATAELRERYPSMGIIILTMFAEDSHIIRAVRAGANGYLLKEIDAPALIRAIHTVAAGGSILDHAVTSRVFALVKSPATRSALDSLSAQETKVLALIAAGKTNKEAAQALNLAEKTVKNYLSTVFEKLQVSSRAHAAALYAQEKRS